MLKNRSMEWSVWVERDFLGAFAEERERVGYIASAYKIRYLKLISRNL